ncbi:hypothetical protein ACFSX9_11795 [Flavobacterium ardleyense]|uniref:Uncharacterized protein n=1 Tax=Flavobacterium ardleyense TaxID=2038737 RepID=A0ABW5ZBE6_9FLAO
MEQNYIIIENILEHQIEEILMELANLYNHTGYTDGIQLYRKQNETSSFLICFTNSPDLDRFTYFVNYLHYPGSKFKVKAFIRGFYQTKDIKELIEFSNQLWVIVYVPKNMEEYDNVNIITATNENYLYDFGGRITKLTANEEKFEINNATLSNYNHIISIYPSKSFEKAEKHWWKFW